MVHGTGTDTRAAAIALALELTETVGFTGFSYRDLAERMGIAAASLHYHFPSKCDLGLALIEHLAAQGTTMFAELERTPDVAVRLRARIDQIRCHRSTDGRMCAFGSLLSDYGQMEAPMQARLRDCESWLVATYARWLDEGRRAGQLSFPGTPLAMAGLMACVFHGILMHRRAQRDLDVDAVLDQFLRLINAF